MKRSGSPDGFHVPQACYFNGRKIQPVAEDFVGMLTEARRRAARGRGLMREFERRSDEVERSDGGVLDLPDHVSGGNLRFGESLIEAMDGAGGDFRLGTKFEPDGNRLAGNDLSDFVEQQVAVLHSGSVRLKARVAGPFSAIEQGREFLELRIVSDGDDQFAIRGDEGLIGDDVGMGVAVALGNLSGDEVVGTDVGEPGEGGIEQGDVDAVTVADAFAGIEGGENRLVGVHAGSNVADGNSDFHRRAVSFAGDAHDAPHRLNEDVVAGFVSEWTGLAEACDAAEDQPRISSGERFVSKSPAVERSGEKIFDEDIGFVREADNEVAAFVRFEIRHEAAFVAVAAEVVGAFSGGEGGPPLAGVITGSGAFDFDDVGAEVSQLHRAIRTGEDSGEVENSNS